VIDASWNVLVRCEEIANAPRGRRGATVAVVGTYKGAPAVELTLDEHEPVRP
jgi:hypothetical protein